MSYRDIQKWPACPLAMGTAMYTATRVASPIAGGGGGPVLIAHRLTLGGEYLTLGGEYLTLLGPPQPQRLTLGGEYLTLGGEYLTLLEIP